MKLVYVLRHAKKSTFKKGITKEGKTACEELKKRLPKFSIVISSQKERCSETARALTGRQPDQDERANVEYSTGTQLVNLITETVQNMRDGEKALIVTHEVCLSPAMQILENVPSINTISFKPLTGFIVNQNLQVKEFN
ncbi:hypothetical protein COV16_02290 [Candidatus Woesearchaeota archaeon CG10_big_fil_rev_8_21_14_0_10_34_8]|nr:MAG: hypothetical protein COV16_02290 [Candidatus Woesearchaeota archaeon CG10_big_fil_rev_8_21_14_0_10_34_8]